MTTNTTANLPPPPLPIHHVFLNPENDQDQALSGPHWHACSAPTTTDAIFAVLQAYDAHEFKPRTVWVLVAGKPGQLHSLVDRFGIEWRS